MRSYLLRCGAVLSLLLLLALPALAQSSGPFYFTDEPGQLDETAIRRAAQPLLDTGNEVAIYFAQNGGKEDFERRLEQDRLKEPGGFRLLTNIIAIYVSLEPAYSEVAGGDDFNLTFRTRINDQANSEFIRDTVLIPKLSSDQFTQAYVETLGAINQAVINPPDPTVDVNGDITPVLWGLLITGGLAIAGATFGARRRAARTLAAAREHFSQTQRNAGAAIANTASALDSSVQQAAHDKRSYDTQDAARLAELQSATVTSFQKAQLVFDQSSEQLHNKAQPNVADYKAAATAYIQVRQQVEAVQQQLAALEAQRRGLDERAQRAPEEIDRAKNA